MAKIYRGDTNKMILSDFYIGTLLLIKRYEMTKINRYELTKFARNDLGTKKKIYKITIEILFYK